MRKISITEILFVLFTQLSHAQGSYWNHTENQGDVWACHAFCATGLVEASYKKETGHYMDLSEADLMLKHFKGSHKNWDNSLRAYLTKGLTTQNPRSLETGTIAKSFAIIKKQGVAYEKEMPYSPTFSMDFGTVMQVMRHEYKAFQTEMKTSSSKRAKVNQILQSHITLIKTKRVQKLLEKEAINLQSRREVKSFLSHYSLKQDKGSTSRTKLIKLLQNQPIAVAYRIKNKHGHLLSMSHVYIIESYNPKTHKFTIRNSDKKGYFGHKGESTEDIIKRIHTIYYLKRN